MKQTNDKGTMMAYIYVDDTMCVEDRSAIDALKIELEKYFSVKDEGDMEKYVGYTVHREKNGRILIQQPHLL